MNLGSREKLISGILEAAKVVGSTFGPRGNTCIIKKYGEYHPTKDGITVLSSLRSEDKSVQLGIDILRDASFEANKIAGDGSTTTTLFTAALIKYLKNSLNNKRNKVDARHIIANTEASLIKLKESLLASAKKVDEHKLYRNLAMVSSNGDEVISHTIYDIFSTLGENAAISVEPDLGGTTHTEYINGFKLDTHITSKMFMDRTAQKSRIKKSYHIVVLKDRVSKVDELKKFLHRDKPTLFIAHQIDPDVVRILANNQALGKVDVNIVTYPQTTSFKRETIADLEAMIDDGLYEVSIDEHSTVIMGVDRDSKTIEERLTALTKEAEDMQDIGIKNLLYDRIANIKGKACKVFIGGQTEAEIKEATDRFEDACNAVRSAISMGYISGGLTGIMLTAESTDINTIVMNALIDLYEVLHEEYVSGENVLLAQKYNDLGIIDSALVFVTAIDKAWSVAKSVVGSKYVVIKDTIDIE